MNILRLGKASIRGTVRLAALAALCLPLSAQAPLPYVTGAIQGNYVAEITFPSRQALHAFIAREASAGVIVSHVTGTAARIFISRETFARLEDQGHEIRLLYREPNAGGAASKHFDGYHTYDQVTAELTQYAGDHPDICRLATLGTSRQGRHLWAMLITDNPDIEEDEPEFKYVSTMHGTEPVGTEMCMYFIGLLLSDYGVDARITDLINETALWIVPLMNPDGLQLGRRGNALNVDLNRAFPAYPGDFTKTYFDGETLGTEGREPEVQHVMNWTAANSFVLSANFHTGALVVNYPYDDDGGPSGTDAPSPDDLLFEDLSLRYALFNAPMRASATFSGGITNGAAWFRISGGMQDWNYRYAGCMDVTIELSDAFRPAGETLPSLWDDNRESMLAYLEGVHLGVRGIVTDHATGAPLWASVTIEGNTQRVYTDPDAGDYHRLLLPGTYTLKIEAPGYIPYTLEAVEVDTQAAVRRDVRLSGGDVNGDGMVDAVDVQLVVNAVLGLAGEFDADVDGRGPSATDIQAVILRALLRAGY